MNQIPTQKVLLLEDSPPMQLIVKTTIGRICDLSIADTIAAAEEHIQKNDFALIILDIGLPDGDGFSFCKRLREDHRFHDIPVIFLTSKSEVEQRVQGFTLGADDYIVKPLEPMEFLARIDARLKRLKSQKVSTSLRKAGFDADLTKQRICYIHPDGKAEDLGLTPLEFKLMVHFLKSEGRVLSRKELIASIWGQSTHVSDHTVDTHISALRKKIGDSSKFLKAVVRQGYRFAMDDEDSSKN